MKIDHNTVQFGNRDKINKHDFHECFHPLPCSLEEIEHRDSKTIKRRQIISIFITYRIAGNFQGINFSRISPVHTVKQMFKNIAQPIVFLGH